MSNVFHLMEIPRADADENPTPVQLRQVGEMHGEYQAQQVGFALPSGAPACPAGGDLAPGPKLAVTATRSERGAAAGLLDYPEA